jgi:hypothetical protein
MGGGRAARHLGKRVRSEANAPYSYNITSAELVLNTRRCEFFSNRSFVVNHSVTITVS